MMLRQVHYKGESRDGQSRGQGILCLPDGTCWEGEWHDGALNGQGVAVYSDGMRYEGQWRNH